MPRLALEAKCAVDSKLPVMQHVVGARSLYVVCNYQQVAHQRMMRLVDMADKLDELKAIPLNLKQWSNIMQDTCPNHQALRCLLTCS